MADIPCQDEEATVDRLLRQIDDALYQLPAAMDALMLCMQTHYPILPPPLPMSPLSSGESMTEDPTENPVDRLDVIGKQIAFSCERIKRHMGKIRSGLLSAKIEAQHRKR